MASLKRCMQVKRCPNCKFRDDLDNCNILRSTYFEYQCPFYKLLDLDRAIEVEYDDND